MAAYYHSCDVHYREDKHRNIQASDRCRDVQSIVLRVIITLCDYYGANSTFWGNGMDFFQVLNLVKKKGYQRLYLRSPYRLTDDDLYEPRRWFEMALYSGNTKLASMGEFHDEWELSWNLPAPSAIQQISFPTGCIELNPMNLLTLGTTNW